MACAPATRSRNNNPAQWSISCWNARASKASVAISTDCPVPAAAPGSAPGRRASRLRSGRVPTCSPRGTVRCGWPRRPPHSAAPPARAPYLRLGVPGDVDAERLRGDAELRCGQADATRGDAMVATRSAHSWTTCGSAGSTAPRVATAPPPEPAAPGGRSRPAAIRARSPGDHHFVTGHRSSRSTGRRLTSTPSSAADLRQPGAEQRPDRSRAAAPPRRSARRAHPPAGCSGR